MKQHCRDDPNWDVDWNLFHAFCSQTPQFKYVFYRDEINEPLNWNLHVQEFGPWHARCLFFGDVPSLHKNVRHKVVLAFVPAHNVPCANFRNRFVSRSNFP